MRQRDGTEALERVRQLRRRSTEAENRLWHYLRSRRLAGFKFRRQVWIGPFIADLVCIEAMLIVEADGSQHGNAVDRDERRTAILAGKGYRALRVWNDDVMQRIDSVLEAIHSALMTVRSPSPSALPSGPLPLPDGERDR